MTDVVANDGLWHFICVTWQSAGGEWYIYLDGKISAYGSNLANGLTVGGRGKLVQYVTEEWYPTLHLIHFVCFLVSAKETTRLQIFISQVVGQEQDRLGGGFNEVESFVGKMTKVEMWNKILNQTEIEVLFGTCEKESFNASFNIWPELLRNIRGNIKVKSKLKTGSSFRAIFTKVDQLLSVVSVK